MKVGKYDIIFSDKTSALLLCIFIASLVWLLDALGKHHEHRFMVPLSYKNLPKDKILINEMPKHLHLYANAKGTDLLRNQIGLLAQKVEIDYETDVDKNKV